MVNVWQALQPENGFSTKYTAALLFKHARIGGYMEGLSLFYVAL